MTDQPICEKCGSTRHIVRWHTGGRYGAGGCGTFAKLVLTAEHLHFTCQNCLYEWATPCADDEGEGGFRQL